MGDAMRLNPGLRFFAEFLPAARACGCARSDEQFDHFYLRRFEQRTLTGRAWTRIGTALSACESTGALISRRMLGALHEARAAVVTAYELKDTAVATLALDRIAGFTSAQITDLAVIHAHARARDLHRVRDAITATAAWFGPFRTQLPEVLDARWLPDEHQLAGAAQLTGDWLAEHFEPAYIERRAVFERACDDYVDDLHRITELVLAIRSDAQRLRSFRA